MEHVAVSSSEHALALLHGARRRRATAATRSNAHSSRSHLVVRLVLPAAAPSPSSVVTLVDLAGSERVDESGATADTLTVRDW